MFEASQSESSGAVELAAVAVTITLSAAIQVLERKGCSTGSGS
jgi:hypothetical protein